MVALPERIKPRQFRIRLPLKDNYIYFEDQRMLFLWKI